MLKMVDGTGIIGVDMICPLGGTVSPPQPPNFDKVEMEGVGSLTLPNSLKAPLERVELIGNSVQGENPAPDNPQEIKSAGKWNEGTQKHEIDVKVTGKNFAIGKLYYCSYSRGIGCTNNLKEATLPFRPKSETQGVGYVVPCKKGETYTFSVTNPNENVCTGITEYTDLNSTINIEKKVGNTLKSKDNLTYTAIGNGVLLCFVAGVWTDGTTTLHECTESELLQVEIGNIPTEYESYTEQSVQIALDEPLRGVGEYKDEIDFKRGKYVQRILKAKPKQPIVFKTRDPNGRCATFDQKLFDVEFKTADSPALSTIAKYSSWANGADGTFALTQLNGFYYKDSTKTLEEVNEIFAKLGTNFEICGVLETPIEHDLPQEVIEAYKQLQSENGTTHVFVDSGEVPCGIKLTYRKEK